MKLLQNNKEKKLKIKRIKIKLKNIIFDKLGLKDEIENKIKLLQKRKEQKIKIKRIRTEIEIQTIKRVKL
jgi:hypothetical protein